MNESSELYKLPDVEPCQLMGGDVPSCVALEQCLSFNVSRDGSSWTKEAHLAAESTTESVSPFINRWMEQLTAVQGAGFLDW